MSPRAWQFLRYQLSHRMTEKVSLFALGKIPNFGYCYPLHRQDSGFLCGRPDLNCLMRFELADSAPHGLASIFQHQEWMRVSRSPGIGRGGCGCGELPQSGRTLRPPWSERGNYRGGPGRMIWWGMGESL